MIVGGGLSAGMAARLAFAVLSALVLGIWLLRSQRPTPNAQRLRIAVLLLCAFWSVTWLVLALTRLRYPFELEWNGGAMRDHCERVLAGHPLYVAPDPDWFPFEYPPLYMWVCALAMRLTGGPSFEAMRAVSILSTLGCAALLALWVNRALVPAFAGMTGRWVLGGWGFIAAGLFLASYRFTGAWYDVERLDMLFLFLSLLGAYCLTPRPPSLAARSSLGKRENGLTPPNSPFPASVASESGKGVGGLGALLSALAFSLAFLTKQQAALFLLGGAAALAWRREGRALAVFSVVSIVACVGAVWGLNRATGGWFGYYCFKVPLSNGMQAHLAMQYVFGDLPLYAPALAIIIIALATSRSRLTTHDSRLTTLLVMAVMGVLGSLMSRAHWGGDQNVLMAGFVFPGALACALAGRWERADHNEQAVAGVNPSERRIDPCSSLRANRARAPLYALLLAQLLTLTYRPDAQLPTAANRAAGERYAAAVRALEREGEVLCLDHGGLTTPRHFVTMGLHDVVHADGRVPPAISAALRSHRYAAVVTDAKPEPDGAFNSELLRYYRPDACLDIGVSWVVTGYPTPGPERRVWVLRPR